MREGHVREGHVRDGHVRDGHVREGHVREGQQERWCVCSLMWGRCSRNGTLLQRRTGSAQGNCRCHVPLTHEISQTCLIRRGLDSWGGGGRDICGGCRVNRVLVHKSMTSSRPCLFPALHAARSFALKGHRTNSTPIKLGHQASQALGHGVGRDVTTRAQPSVGG